MFARTPIKPNNLIKATKTPISTSFDKTIGLNYPGKALRATTQNFEQIYADDGFLPRGINKSLELHVEGRPGNYVSYGQSVLHSTKFCRLIHFHPSAYPFDKIGFGSFMYVSNVPKIHVNVAQSYLTQTMPGEAFGQPSFALQEHEIAGVGKMPVSDILKSRKFFAVPGIGFPYFFVGPTFTNQDYSPRNWTIAIPSACADEALRFEQGFRSVKFLKDDLRFIMPEEAEVIAGELDNQARKYNVTMDSKLIVFRTVPAHFNQEQAVACITKEYEQFNKNAGVEAKSTVISTHSSLIPKIDLKPTNSKEPNNAKEKSNTLTKIEEAAQKQTDTRVSQYQGVVPHSLFVKPNNKTNQEAETAKKEEEFIPPRLD